MNRMVSRLCACLVAFSLFAALCGGMVARAADGFDYNYTYTYDYWGDERQSPDAYRTSAMLSSVSLGLETPMRTPRGLTVSGNDIYIVDTGNNRILQVARDGESFTLTRVISEISGDITPNTLSAPQDVFVMADGTLFIADTNNNRILKADRNLNLLSVFTRPTDATFDQSMAFLPTKLVCDTTGRVFCLAQNVNRGLMKYEADGTFTGFIGAFKSYSDAVALFGVDLNTAGMNTLVGYIYDMLYGNSGGYPSFASAAAIILFAIVLTITCINLLVSRKHVHY